MLGLDHVFCMVSDPGRAARLVFLLEAGEDELEQRRLRRSDVVAHRPAGELHEVRVRGPSRPFLPPFAGPPVVYLQGPHLLELVMDDEGPVRQVSDGLAIRSFHS